MRDWLHRAKMWTDVGFGDPSERIESAMVRVFLVATVLLAGVGLFDLLRLRTPESGVQFVAAALLSLFTLWMDRSGRAYPRTVLAIAALAGLISVTGATLDEDYLRLTDASPTVIIALTGVLALVLGGKWAKYLAWFWVCLLVAVVSIARWPVTNSISQVFTDTATTLIVSALAFTAVVATRNATQQSRADYERLMDTAPVGVVELDLRDVCTTLRSSGVLTLAAYEKGIANGNIDPFPILGAVKVTRFNRTAGSDLFLARESGEVAAMGRGSACTITGVLARIVFNDGPGSVELSFEAEGTGYHQVLNWNAGSSDRRNVVLISTDITAQKAAEEALTDEIKDKDEFIASVSHELRTPLTAVVGLVDELTRTGSPIDPLERDELMAIIADQSHEVADIVEDLLVAAQAAGGNLAVHPIPIDMSSVVGSTLQLSEDEIICEIAADVQAYADPTRLRQIARNLVSNAIRHGGRHRRVRVRQAENQAIVEVSDDGAAIPDSLRQTMFEPYERTNHLTTTNPDSVGLGLTVARSLARSMGGDLEYEHDGTESIFRLMLPANPPDHSILHAL